MSRPRVIGILIGILVFAAVTAFVELDSDEEVDRPPGEAHPTATAPSQTAAGVTPSPPVTGTVPANEAVLLPIDDCSCAQIYDVPWWVHIRAEEGIVGWVRPEFVRWAE